MYQIFIFGEDSRQQRLAGILADAGISITCAYETNPKWAFLSFEQAVRTCPMILAPVPFTKDLKTVCCGPDGIPGKKDRSQPESATPCLSIPQFLSRLRPGQTLFGGSLPLCVTDYGQKHGISCRDYMDQETVRIKNAVATAEGAICEAIQASPRTLQGSAGLVAGYGRCGQVLARKLKELDLQLTVLEQNEVRAAQAQADGFPVLFPEELPDSERAGQLMAQWHFLFNTIPCPLFGKAILSGMRPDITIIDIASAPGGVDFEFCNRTGRTARFCPGLPGRYAPESAARILADVVLRSVQTELKIKNS